MDFTQNGSGDEDYLVVHSAVWNDELRPIETSVTTVKNFKSSDIEVFEYKDKIWVDRNNGSAFAEVQVVDDHGHVIPIHHYSTDQTELEYQGKIIFNPNNESLEFYIDDVLYETGVSLSGFSEYRVRFYSYAGTTNSTVIDEAKHMLYWTIANGIIYDDFEYDERWDIHEQELYGVTSKVSFSENGEHQDDFLKIESLNWENDVVSSRTTST